LSNTHRALDQFGAQTTESRSALAYIAQAVYSPWITSQLREWYAIGIKQRVLARSGDERIMGKKTSRF